MLGIAVPIDAQSLNRKFFEKWPSNALMPKAWIKNSLKRVTWRCVNHACPPAWREWQPTCPMGRGHDKNEWNLKAGKWALEFMLEPEFFFVFFFFWPPPRLALQVYSDAHFWHLARYGMDWAWKVVVKCKRVAFLGGRGGVEFYYFCLFGRSARVFFSIFFAKSANLRRFSRSKQLSTLLEITTASSFFSSHF